MSEWADYKIVFDKPLAGPPCELKTLYHVVHIPVARRILEDGRLRAGLIYDESKLRRSRISVTWLSAKPG